MVFQILWSLPYVLAILFFAKKKTKTKKGSLPPLFSLFLSITINCGLFFLKFQCTIINYIYFRFRCSGCPKLSQYLLFSPVLTFLWSISISFWVVCCFLTQNIPSLPSTLLSLPGSRISHFIQEMFSKSHSKRKKSSFCICGVFKKILFIYSWDTQRERQREKQAPCGELDAELYPSTLESWPEPKADTQLTESEPPRYSHIYYLVLCQPIF